MVTASNLMELYGGAFYCKSKSPAKSQLSFTTKQITAAKSRPLKSQSQRSSDNSTDCCKVINLSMPEICANPHPHTLKYYNKRTKERCRGSSSMPNMPFSTKGSGENAAGHTYSNSRYNISDRLICNDLVLKLTF